MTLSPVIGLFVIQPTPFCNIDCQYCYLPDRDNTGRLSADLLRKALTQIHDSGLAPLELSIVWHAGEPLSLPLRYYRELFSSIDLSPIPRSRIRHSMQTNGMLLSDEWCAFISEQSIHIGLSIDGPDFLHDLHRKDRQGRGTHARAMQGLAALRRNGIDFHVIAVITADSLAYPDEIFRFFLDHQIERLGFNIEELEGCHQITSLAGGAREAQVRKFWERLYQLQKESRGAIRIREFERAYCAITQTRPDATSEEWLQRNEQVAPLGILSMDWRGNLSSFSPELLGLKSIHYGDFTFGHVTDQSFRGIGRNAKFRQVAEDIATGVRMCEKSCPYFCICGGGAPANKYYENGSFASTETMYCRTTVQMPANLVMADLEGALGLVVK